MDDQTQRLYATTDAQVWAQEFMANFGHQLDKIDEGLMIGWFANAFGTVEMLNQHYERGYADGQRDTAHALMGLDK